MGQHTDDPSYFSYTVPIGKECFALAARDHYWDDPTVEVRCIPAPARGGNMQLIVRAVRMEDNKPCRSCADSGEKHDG
jgi:hypothetical protein